MVIIFYIVCWMYCYEVGPMAEQLKITTAADMLISLLESTPQVSFKDAAKQLGLSLELVEQMATFLEEEGSIDIRYRFTTPYLSLKQKKIVSSKQVLNTLKTEMVQLSNSVLNMKAKITAGDFSALQQISNQVITKLRQLQDTFVIPNSSLPAAKKKELSKELESLANELDRAHKLVNSGEFNDAKILHDEINYTLTLHLNALKHISSFSNEQAEELGSKDINKLLALAYESIQKNDLDKARDIHSKLVNSYQSLNFSFSHQKDVLERHLVKLSKDLSSNIDESNIALVNAINNAIQKYATEIDDALKKGQINKAQRLYEFMRKRFTQFPPGFLDKKKQLQQQVLSTFAVISNIREESLKKQFEIVEKKILTLFSEMEVAMQNNDLSTAEKVYGETRQLFSQLPSSFLERRTDIQSRLLQLYLRLVKASEQKSLKKTREITTTINKQLESLHTLLTNKKLSDAVKLYAKIKELYLQLPKGFLHEKTILQNKIFDFYQELSLYAIRETEEEAHTRQQEIEFELKRGFEFLNAGKMLLAEEIYSHLIKLYNQMPEGFSKEKVKLRTRILSLYKEITLNSSQKETMPTDRNNHVMHQELVRRFLAASHHIAQEKFNLLTQDYESAERLFKKMPLGFTEQHPHLKDMLDVIKLQVDFLQTLQQLSELASFKNKNVLDNHIKKIISMRILLEKKAPQDNELLRYGALLLQKYEREHTSSGQVITHDFPTQDKSAFVLPPTNQQHHLAQTTTTDSLPDAKNPSFATKMKASSTPQKIQPADVDIDHITKQIHQLRKKTSAKVKIPTQQPL